MKKTTTTIFLIIFSLIITGCTTLNNISDPNINNFKTEQEFIEFISKNEIQPLIYGETRTITTLSQGIESDSSMQTTTYEFSSTNVQVQNIDELDIIKTDGEYIYTTTKDSFFIIQANPAEDAQIIFNKTLNNTISGMFIHENILAITGIVKDSEELNDLGLNSFSGLSFLNLYDVSIKEEPKLVKSFKFDGNYFNARLLDGIMYLSTNFNPYQRPTPMPIIVTNGVRKTLSPKDIYFFEHEYNNPSFVGIYSIDLNSLNKIDSIILTLDNNQNLYMSHNNIYVSFEERINIYELENDFLTKKIIPKLSRNDIDYINRVKAVDNDILNEREKKNKILTLINRFISQLDSTEQNKIRDEVRLEVKEHTKTLKYLEYTIINKISTDNGVLNFVATNKIPGRVYGQFAFDEHENFLRVTTTLSNGALMNEEYDVFNWQLRSPSQNNVYVLDENLNLVGSLEGLAPTESIYSARYVEDRLYLVTFREVDPFFVIDLSDPRNLTELGELKITGYSRYLHPYDKNTVIGIGREGTETGRILGLKVSLFDVSNVSNPIELTTYIADDRITSGAEWEHKAFLFSKEKELLVLPIEQFSYRFDTEPDNFAGTLVFKINKEEISPKGIIMHSQGTNTRTFVERALYINNYLFTKSTNLLRINKLDSLQAIKNITLTTQTNDIPLY